MNYLQQGDVLFHKEKIPKEAKSSILKEGIVQHGEMTNHAHRLNGNNWEYFQTPKKERFLRVIQPTALTHEEHNAIDLPPGEYRIGIVREYDHFEEEAREVID